MAKQIKFLEVESDVFNFEWKQDELNEFLKDKKIINVETLKHTIKFWYIKED